MGGIFISYRRVESQTFVGRIYDRLHETFGELVFRDVSSIPFGRDFREYIDQELAKCDTVLVIIGPQWHTVTDREGNPRLNDPEDFVRVEIELAHKRELLIIPVLVGGASLPDITALPGSLHFLPYLNAAFVRDDPDFHTDMDRLIKQLGGEIKSKEAHPGEALPATLRRPLVVALAAVMVLLIAGGGWALTQVLDHKGDEKDSLPDLKRIKLTFQNGSIGMVVLSSWFVPDADDSAWKARQTELERGLPLAHLSWLDFTYTLPRLSMFDYDLMLAVETDEARLKQGGILSHLMADGVFSPSDAVELLGFKGGLDSFYCDNVRFLTDNETLSLETDEESRLVSWNFKVVEVLRNLCVLRLDYVGRPDWTFEDSGYLTFAGIEPPDTVHEIIFFKPLDDQQAIRWELSMPADQYSLYQSVIDTMIQTIEVDLVEPSS